MYRGSAIAVGLLFAGLGVLGLSHEAWGKRAAKEAASPAKK